VTYRKAATWLGVAFVIFFVLYSPTDAGGVVRSAFDGLGAAGAQFGTFVKRIFT
jgi:hypothetical protein